MDGSRETEHSGEEEPIQQGERGGLITPLGGTRRGMDPQKPRIGSDCLVRRSTNMLGLRKDIYEGHLGDVSMSSWGKLLPSNRQEIVWRRDLVFVCSYSSLPKEVSHLL